MRTPSYYQYRHSMLALMPTKSSPPSSFLTSTCFSLSNISLNLPCLPPPNILQILTFVMHVKRAWGPQRCIFFEGRCASYLFLVRLTSIHNLCSLPLVEIVTPGLCMLSIPIEPSYDIRSQVTVYVNIGVCARYEDKKPTVDW